MQHTLDRCKTLHLVVKPEVIKHLGRPCLDERIILKTVIMKYGRVQRLGLVHTVIKLLLDERTAVDIPVICDIIYLYRQSTIC
jgi:hypothetical protein